MGVDSGLPDFRGPEGFWRATIPHTGFAVLGGSGLPARVFTSNVDGQFQKAGLADVAECQGRSITCSARWTAVDPSADGVTVEIDETTMRATPPMPTCPDSARSRGPTS